MTIIIEDGTTVSGANSYVTDLELDAYISDRGITLSGDAEQSLFKAMDYLESQNFIGDKSSRDQALQWPRDDVYIDDYYYASTVIPTHLKNAQLAIAVSIDAGADPLAVESRATKREKVGDIEVEYTDDARAADMAPIINASLQKIVKGSSFGFSAQVARA